MMNCPKCASVVNGGTVCAVCEAYSAVEDSLGHWRTPEETDRDPAQAGSVGSGAIISVDPAADGADRTVISSAGGAGGGAYHGIEAQERDLASDCRMVKFHDGIAVSFDEGLLRFDWSAQDLWRVARAEINRPLADTDNVLSMILSPTEMHELMQKAGMLSPQMGMAKVWNVSGNTVTVNPLSGRIGGGNGFIIGTGLPGLPGYANPMAPPKPVTDGGIVVGEIIGWRCWNLTAGCLLRSISVDSTWMPGSPMNACDGPYGADWEVKFPTGGGVHAWKKKEDAFKYGASGVGPQGAVIGTVRLSGQVIEHERGYRAECAEIASLDWLVSDMPLAEYNSSLQRVRALYGVDGDGGYMKSLDAGPPAPGHIVWATFSPSEEENDRRPWLCFAGVGVVTLLVAIISFVG